MQKLLPADITVGALIQMALALSYAGDEAYQAADFDESTSLTPMNSSRVIKVFIWLFEYENAPTRRVSGWCIAVYRLNGGSSAERHGNPEGESCYIMEANWKLQTENQLTGIMLQLYMKLCDYGRLPRNTGTDGGQGWQKRSKQNSSLERLVRWLQCWQWPYDQLG